MKALVVDHSAVMRKVLASALGRCGIHEVVQAGNGQEGLEAARSEDFDLVLMDWNLPVMRGSDAARAMRELGKTMPILLLATETEKDRVFEALKGGVTQFIIKPAEPATLDAKITAALAAGSRKAPPTA